MEKTASIWSVKFIGSVGFYTVEAPTFVAAVDTAKALARIIGKEPEEIVAVEYLAY